MYTVHIDLHLHYSPPLDEHGRAIVFTRVFELPFVPYDGLLVHGRMFEELSEPMGYALKDVIWDVDRGVFLARTSCGLNDIPLAEIDQDLRGWLGRGWRVGSYRDPYSAAWVAGIRDFDPTPADAREERHHERLHRLDPRLRPAALNALVRALVRLMVTEMLVSEATAYAIDRTGRYFAGDELEQHKNKAHVKKWQALRAGFPKLSEHKQDAWRAKVMGYPSLAEVLAAPSL